MFIERLNKEQLCDFFRLEGYCIDEKDISFFIDGGIFNKNDEYLCVSINDDKKDVSLHYRFYDFEDSTISNEQRWRNYLYTIFGEEYKDAYKEYLLNQMTKKFCSLETIALEDEMELQ